MRQKTFILYTFLLGCLTMATGACTGEAVDPGYTVSINQLKVSDLTILGNTADTVLVIEASSAWTLQVVSGDEHLLGLSRKAGNGSAKYA